MRIVPNSGSDRVIDLARASLESGGTVDLMSPVFSLFAFAELLDQLNGASGARLVLPADRAARNRLQARWLAEQAASWIESKAQIRRPESGVPQAALVVRDGAEAPEVAALGSFAFSTGGLGITPGNPMSVIQASESAEEAARLAQWFDATWTALPANANDQADLIAHLRDLAAHRSPAEVYARILQQVLGGESALGEGQGVNAATGIRDAVGGQKPDRHPGHDRLEEALQVPARRRGRSDRQDQPLRRLHHRRLGGTG